MGLGRARTHAPTPRLPARASPPAPQKPNALLRAPPRALLARLSRFVGVRGVNALLSPFRADHSLVEEEIKRERGAHHLLLPYML